MQVFVLSSTKERSDWTNESIVQWVYTTMDKAIERCKELVMEIIKEEWEDAEDEDDIFPFTYIGLVNAEAAWIVDGFMEDDRSKEINPTFDVRFNMYWHDYFRIVMPHTIQE